MRLIVITLLLLLFVIYSYSYLRLYLIKLLVGIETKMASAQSLMGLMTQLQSMENNFTCILMEAALKLASLTGIQVYN